LIPGQIRHQYSIISRARTIFSSDIGQAQFSSENTLEKIEKKNPRKSKKKSKKIEKKWKKNQEKSKKNPTFFCLKNINFFFV
jgi:hypothetical protein